MSAVSYPYVEVSSDGIAYVEGTRTKVVEIVLDQLAHHWDAEEIRRQHPHLSLAQIHAALTYYYDHQAELDRDIQARLNRVDQIQQELGPSPLRAKLNRRGGL